jgi:HPt (histidine-containing phosphotransfer) domain-containing protein
MESVLGDESTREIVRLFLRDFPESMARLASGTREEQVRIVHGLKSSSLHMGATALSELMASLEERLTGHGGDLLQEDLDAAEARFEAAAGGLRKYAGA